VSRRELGYPDSWKEIENWTATQFNFGLPIQEEFVRTEKRFNNTNFAKKQPQEFWDQFQKNELPKNPTTRIRTNQLRKEVAGVQALWTSHQRKDAETAIRNLAEGAPAHQKQNLKGAILRNAASAFQYGPEVMANIEKWLKEKYLAGPFPTPPMDNFRANSIMAVEQHGKVRLILNMSYPKGESFNDNVDKEGITRVTMSSPKQFGQSLIKAGKGATMSKLDLKDAYKQVPAKLEDLRLQGIHWAGAFFVETQQIFGSSASVSNFDVVAKTIQDVAITRSKIPRRWVHRTLDDTAVVSPKGSGFCESFTAEYTKLCNNINMKLAPDCPENEKAFRNQAEGTVLGIRFNAKTLEWRISQEKAAKVLEDVHLAANAGHLDLKQMEQLHGRLDNFGQMAPFLQAFKRPLNDYLAAFQEDYDIILPVPEEVIEDLRVWAAVAVSATKWQPIERALERPPVDSLTFVSDAAGGTGHELWAGVASLGLLENGGYWFLCSGRWPPAILTEYDDKGAALASKTTMLETVGLLLPFLTAADEVRGRNIVLGVDNMAVYFAWENRSSKGDQLASVLMRALHIVAAYLECRVFVEHVPRCSTPASRLADSLTRASSATADSWNQVRGVRRERIPKELKKWLRAPTVDWQLGLKLVKDI